VKQRDIMTKPKTEYLKREWRANKPRPLSEPALDAAITRLAKEARAIQNK